MSETLFLSTVSREFGEFRTRLAQFLQRTKRVHVRHQDDFVQHGVKTLHMLEEEVVKSDFVVHVIGAESGWSPRVDQAEDFLRRHADFAVKFPTVAADARLGEISATQWEAWLALFFGKRLYSYEFPDRLVPDSSQARHSQRLHDSENHPKTIKKDDALFDEILCSLIERGLLTEAEAERKIAPSRILRHSPQKLFGRETWLDALDAAWASDNVNVYTLVAWGGVGKTSLVAHWVANRIAAKGWPGVDRYFDWSFYSQGTGESRQTSSDLFIQEALKFFDDPDPILGSPWERGERLAHLIRQHRTLLVLDGIEPLQYPINDPQAGRLKDGALEALVQGLAQDNPGLCVITTREHLKNIECFDRTKEEKLDKLLKDAAIALLRHLQIVGTDEEMAAAWKDAGGHALTLQLLGRFLADAHGGDIRLRSQVHFEEIDAEHQGRSAFKVMIAYEKWFQSVDQGWFQRFRRFFAALCGWRLPNRQRELAILRLTGLFDRPISSDCLQALRAAPAIPGLTDSLVTLKDAQWNVAMNRLLDIDLLSQPDAGDSTQQKYRTQLAVDAHPLIREYFAEKLKREHFTAFQAAHSRLFDFLCENTPYRPDGIEGLAPLYQAVMHGCLAGRQQEAGDKVYFDRILRGNEAYSTKRLGAIGADLAAVAAFFEQPWIRLSAKLTEPDQAWLLAEAAFSLRALGRLTEALQPMKAGLEKCIKADDWKRAARVASNLSELEVTLGQLPEAIADGRQSIVFADRSGDAFEKMGKRTTAAAALYQSGEIDEAHTLFVAAETMQRERQPAFELLYSLPGFNYCDLLLTSTERAAWLNVSRAELRSVMPTVVSHHVDANVAKELEDVDGRARYALSIVLAGSRALLDIANNHLTLARVAVYRVILTATSAEHSMVTKGEVAAAVNGLRQAGVMDHLPKGLLTAALYHFITGNTAAAKRCLDETEQIALRGPIPLQLADVHLHRARLFRDKGELAKAAELIRSLGYGRRYDELADAEAAAEAW